MGVQLSYPGIYTQEFTPGAPIQGVSTSTGAFIGTATSGPIGVPTKITSWDAYNTLFGGFIAQPPTSFLPAAVYGFFLNQGTSCYILRIGTGAMATAELLTRQSPAQTDLIATAQAEGIIGNSLSVQVIDSSRLASMLKAASAVSIFAMTAASPVQATTTAAHNFTTGQIIAISGTSATFTGVTAGTYTVTVISPTTFTLNGTTGTGTYSPGAFTATTTATTLSLASASTKIVGFDATATILTLASNAGLVAGDKIELANGATTATATIGSTQGTTIVVLLAPVANATALAAGGTGTARTADLYAGQLALRVNLPNGLVLSQALPAGALVSLTLSGTSENLTVASSGGTTITFTTALQNSYSMAGPALPQIASLEFDLVVAAATSETWPQLSMNPTHPSYWGKAVNSQLITLSTPPTPPTGTLSDPRPADAIYNLGGGTDDDRATALTNFIANPTATLAVLAPIQDVDIVAIPGITDPNAQAALVNHCETLFNRFAILDAIQDTPLDAATGFPALLQQYAQVRTPDGFAAIYFPWIQVVNPLTGATEYWPPSGHVMGIYAQTDQNRGVYKAPANVPIAGALGVQYALTNADQGPLNLLGINILRTFPEQAQPLVWGARTTATDSDWQYVNIRRLFIYLEQSIEQGIRWAIFEPNNQMLWGKLKRTITEFLNRVQSDGGIISFYVRIDSTLNPPATQALGQLYIEVGIQPTYPAEFIILRIGIWQGGSSVSES
jgi:hypothetical protein